MAIENQHDQAGADAADGEDTSRLPRLSQWFLWADRPAAVQRLIVGLAVLCAVLFLLDFVVHRHTEVPGEGFPGFYAIVGFISFTVIVLGAKALRTLIRRDESFYAPFGVDAETYPERGTERLSLAGSDTHTAGDTPVDGSSGGHH